MRTFRVYLALCLAVTSLKLRNFAFYRWTKHHLIRLNKVKECFLLVLSLL